MRNEPLNKQIIGKTIKDMEVFENNEYSPDTFCLRNSLATIKLIFEDNSILILTAENATNYDLKLFNDDIMKTCEKCKYFTIEPTGFENPYILLCDKSNNQSIYLGYVEILDDIDGTFEICDDFEEMD